MEASQRMGCGDIWGLAQAKKASTWFVIVVSFDIELDFQLPRTILITLHSQDQSLVFYSPRAHIPNFQYRLDSKSSYYLFTVTVKSGTACSGAR